MTAAGAPGRPDEAPWLRRRERSWLSMFAVLAVIVATTVGGFVVAAALAQPAGPPVGFPGLVQVQPLSGWEPADPGTVAGRASIPITRGNGTLLVIDWGTAPGDAAALARAVVDDALTPSFTQLTVSEQLEPVTLADGTPGARFTFVGVDPDSGSSLEGEVTAVVDSAGQGVVFVGVAPEGSLAFVDGDLHTMIDLAEVA